MAYSSLSFDPSAMQTELNTASLAAVSAVHKASHASVAAAKGVAASTAIADSSALWHKGSAASAAIAAQSAAWEKGSAASAAVLVLASSVIKSIPGATSFVIKEFVYTAGSAIKMRRSTAAAA